PPSAPVVSMDFSNNLPPYLQGVSTVPLTGPPTFADLQRLNASFVGGGHSEAQQPAGAGQGRNPGGNRAAMAPPEQVDRPSGGLAGAAVVLAPPAAGVAPKAAEPAPALRREPEKQPTAGPAIDLDDQAALLTEPTNPDALARAAAEPPPDDVAQL